MGIRDDKKEQTRQLLLDATLHQSLRVGFAGVSLRKVARAAGITPNAVYSHFRTLEDIGLALIRHGTERLRDRIRAVRAQADAAPDAAIKDSVMIYLHYVQENKELLEFFMRERSGGSYALRTAAAEEIRYITRELADDLGSITPLRPMSNPDRFMLSDLVVNTIINQTLEILELRPEQELRQQDLVHKMIKQLRLIFLGAANWSSEQGAADLGD